MQQSQLSLLVQHFRKEKEMIGPLCDYIEELGLPSVAARLKEVQHDEIVNYYLRFLSGCETFQSTTQNYNLIEKIASYSAGSKCIERIIISDI